MEGLSLEKVEVRLAVYAAITAGVIVAAVFLPWILYERSVAGFPLMGKEFGSYARREKHYMAHSVDLYAEGQRKFKSNVYRLTTSEGEHLVLPLRFLDELRKLPDTVVDHVTALERGFEAKTLGIKIDDPLTIHLIKSVLTHNLPRVNYRLSEELERAIPEDLPQGDNWTAVNIHMSLLRIVAIASGHIFLGPELCRREEYLYASINYTIDLFKAAEALKRWSLFLRPLGSFFIPELGKIADHRRRAREFLSPVIQERKRLLEEGGEVPDDMLQWMINEAESGKWGTVTEAQLAENQLGLSLMAIHTTTLTTTHIIYDIIGYCPEIVPELRAEIRAVMAANDGVMTTQALFQMKLLDSVMRESQRLNPVGISRFVRYLQRPLRFADGTRIPAHTTISVNMYHTNLDPALYPDPGRFDPRRFLDLRLGAADDPIRHQTREQYQFVAVTKENMGFGFGRHACPGRFFAANEIKLMLARLLLDYDWEMPAGEEAGRYANVVHGGSILPDPTRSVMIRRAAAA